jgi:hypothetical protein
MTSLDACGSTFWQGRVRPYTSSRFFAMKWKLLRSTFGASDPIMVGSINPMNLLPTVKMRELPNNSPSLTYRTKMALQSATTDRFWILPDVYTLTRIYCIFCGAKLSLPPVFSSKSTPPNNLRRRNQGKFFMANALRLPTYAYLAHKSLFIIINPIEASLQYTLKLEYHSAMILKQKAGGFINLDPVVSRSPKM